MTSATISVENFYQNYHGHTIKDLTVVHDKIRALKSNPTSSVIFLAGDSSMDNKAWVGAMSGAANGYESFLNPAISVEDIAHNLNQEIVSRGLGDEFTVLNTAIEESTVGDRACMSLMAQDKFIRDHITAKDSLILSVGGNDIALRPSCCTVINTLSLLYCTTASCIESCACGCALPCDDWCCGSTTSCFSNLFAWPCGYGYFLHLFGTRVQALARRIVSGPNKPKRVLICMIYYPDTTATGSWADLSLSCLGYNRNPKHLQTLIKKVFNDATKKISIPGVEVIAVPMFVAMDGSVSSDYEQRVEPSANGGAKLAKLFMDAILQGTSGVESAMAEWEQKRLTAETASVTPMQRA